MLLLLALAWLFCSLLPETAWLPFSVAGGQCCLSQHLVIGAVLSKETGLCDDSSQGREVVGGGSLWLGRMYQTTESPEAVVWEGLSRWSAKALEQSAV